MGATAQEVSGELAVDHWGESCSSTPARSPATASGAHSVPHQYLSRATLPLTPTNLPTNAPTQPPHNSHKRCREDSSWKTKMHQWSGVSDA